LDNQLYTKQEFDRKVSLLNTAEVGVAELKKAENIIGRELSRPQKELFVANTTAQKLLNEHKKEVTDIATLEKIDAKLENLQHQQTQLLDDKVQFDEFGNVVDDTKLSVPIEGLDEQGIPIGDNVPAPVKVEKIFTDFDKTLFHQGKLTPLGEEMKSRIEKGEDITILTSRENTPENIDFIARTLGIPHENIKAGLDPDMKAAELTAYEGSKVFYDDNPDNVAAAQKTNARVIDTGITSDEQRIPTLFRDLQETGNANEYLNPEKITESIEEIQNQALTAPAGLKGKVGEKLTVELIARNTVEDINKAIDTLLKKVSGEEVTATETKDADRHIRLLEKGLEEKAKLNTVIPEPTNVEGTPEKISEPIELSTEVKEPVTETTPVPVSEVVSDVVVDKNEVNKVYHGSDKKIKAAEIITNAVRKQFNTSDKPIKGFFTSRDRKFVEENKNSFGEVINEYEVSKDARIASEDNPQQILNDYVSAKYGKGYKGEVDFDKNTIVIKKDGKIEAEVSEAEINKFVHEHYDIYENGANETIVLNPKVLKDTQSGKEQSLSKEQPSKGDIGNVDIYEYQDKNAEKIISKSWNGEGGNVWRYKFENAGDVLRELSKYKDGNFSPAISSPTSTPFRGSTTSPLLDGC